MEGIRQIQKLPPGSQGRGSCDVDKWLESRGRRGKGMRRGTGQAVRFELVSEEGMCGLEEWRQSGGRTRHWTQCTGLGLEDLSPGVGEQ